MYSTADNDDKNICTGIHSCINTKKLTKSNTSLQLVLLRTLAPVITMVSCWWISWRSLHSIRFLASTLSRTDWTLACVASSVVLWLFKDLRVLLARTAGVFWSTSVREHLQVLAFFADWWWCHLRKHTLLSLQTGEPGYCCFMPYNSLQIKQNIYWLLQNNFLASVFMLAIFTFRKKLWKYNTRIKNTIKCKLLRIMNVKFAQKIYAKLCFFVKRQAK